MQPKRIINTFDFLFFLPEFATVFRIIVIMLMMLNLFSMSGFFWH